MTARLYSPLTLLRLLAGKRRVAVSALAVILGAVLVSFLTLMLSEKSIDQAVSLLAQQKAASWYAHFDQNIRRAAPAVEAGTLEAADLRLPRHALSPADMFRLRVFDPEGRQLFSSETAPSADGALGTARAVFVRQAPETVLNHIREGPSAEVVVQVFMPAYTKDGDPFAVLELSFNLSMAHRTLADSLSLISVILPVLAALAYLLPAIGYLVRAEQAKVRDRRVQQLSHFDELTGVLNRRGFSEASDALFSSRSARSTQIGVLFLDVDMFKAVNDEFGHAFGDAYLRNVATILMGCVRRTDLVGRMGGDEFVVILPDMGRHRLLRTADMIQEAARKPFEFDGRFIQGQLSVGIHLAERTESLADALHAADLALYHAKASGRNMAIEYFEGLDVAMKRRRTVEARMRRALDQNLFEVVYQPLTNPRSGLIVGFEALTRLLGEDGEAISPAEFVPIAEETGMIHDIGETTLRRAVQTAGTWPEPVFVSVNLSPVQFRTGDLVDKVSATLEEFDFPPDRLELEVTENLLMADEDRVARQIHGFKGLGVSIAMDDFGTGYSSLGYLWKYNFNKIKIDRIFLEGYEYDSEKHRDIIETIVILGHKMGMQVTVEGVENARQVAMLNELGCDQYQGFLFGHPMPAHEARRALQDQSARVQVDGTTASG